MNIDDLSWQARHHGGIYPRLARTLVDLGETELLIGAAQERGDWTGTQAAARALCAAGDTDRAAALVAPFREIGWREADWATAEIMIVRGEGEEALATVRPDAAALGDGHACARYAELAATAGRADEAIDVLAPHLGESWLRSRLVQATEGQGRDDRVLHLLTREAERMEHKDSEGCGRCGQACRASRTDRWDVLLLISQVLERAGRAQEAVEVMRTETASGRRHPLNFPEHHAQLLARQGLIEELRALAEAEHRAAFAVYAKALEDTGRAPEAEALLREAIEAHDAPNDRAALMRLLVRQARIDEAVEAGRPTYDYYDCWNLLHWALELLVGDGRPGRALELLDGLTGAWAEGHPDQVLDLRLWLLGEAGRCEQAIAQATALNEKEPGEWDLRLARLLERDGRLEEALALLRTSTQRSALYDLVDMLLEHGRPAEALASVPTIAETRAAHEQREREAAARRPQDDPCAVPDGYASQPPF
ncbi:hypothetical protein ACFC26_27325 [Kitasatospora purpeofusca]|uniref:hypothetical protein n=1 Tax=Kitasatospora purpeofusca TaxID=67352 RepID=UPI0035DE6F2A